MSMTTVARTIQAPLQTVFRAVSLCEEFEKAVPGIVKIEFLGEQRSGVGTRFRETRLMKGREASTVLEVTEQVDDEHIRLVADEHGTVWDSVFTVRSEGAATVLTLNMEARAYKLLPKLMNPFLKGMVQKALEQDMDSIKAYCESRGSLQQGELA